MHDCSLHQLYYSLKLNKSTPNEPVACVETDCECVCVPVCHGVEHKQFTIHLRELGVFVPDEKSLISLIPFWPCLFVISNSGWHWENILNSAVDEVWTEVQSSEHTETSYSSSFRYALEVMLFECYHSIGAMGWVFSRNNSYRNGNVP